MRRPLMHSACYLALMFAYIVAAAAYGVLIFDAMKTSGSHAVVAVPGTDGMEEPTKLLATQHAAEQ